MIDIKKINRASVFLKQGDFKSAEKIYSELLRDYPNNETVLSFWGLFQIKSGNLIKAEKVLETAYKIKKSASTIAALAYVKFKNKKFDDSIIYYEELFRYDKNSPKIYCQIIRAFKYLGMPEFVDVYCQKFLKVHPKDENALIYMSQYYMDIRDYDNAGNYCAEIIKMYPNNSTNWINSGLLQELLGKEETAQECYKIAIENGDNRGYYHLAVSYEKSQNDDKSFECFNKCIENNVNLDITIPSLGLLYLKTKDFYNGYKNFILRESSSDVKILKSRWLGEKDRNFSKDKTILVYC